MPFLGTTGSGSVKQFGGQANLGYFIKNSLRFRSSASAYLNRTPASATNRTTWTWSGWVKRGTLSSLQFLFQQGADQNNATSFQFNSSNTLEYNHADSGVNTDQCVTSAVFRDPSAWYHIVLSVDTTQATDTNRVKIYVNGNLQTLGTANYPAQNVDTDVNTANPFRIGSQVAGTPYYLDGYLTEINFIDGQALTPSSFGKTDAATNQWIPKKFAGTYGTNGFYLKFADASAATAAAIGKDSSGNGNNWTPNNISLSATVIKSFTTTGTTSWIPPTDVTTVNYLVVAGGGGGGASGPTMYDSGAGGGGAGGVREGTLVVIPGTSYTVTVGAAGSGGTSRGAGANGSNSVFASITSIGGGGGAPGVAGNNGYPGGSGGGSSVSGTGGSGTPGQGFAGGSSTTSSGAGGGGAGAVGSASPNNGGGNGGAGYTSSISGSPVTYGGGGGGGAYAPSPGTAGSGGSSIGGAGGTNNSNGSNASGYGSGGGGAGGTYNTTGTLSGGAGSNGIVIISYTTSSTQATTNDAMVDSPTRSAVASNYCVLNPLVPDSASASATRTFSDGNLKIRTTTSVGAQSDIYGNFGVSSGKWYYEVILTGGNTDAGVGWSSAKFQNYCNYYGGNGYKYTQSGSSAYGATWTTNDVIGIAYDADNNTMTFYKNGASQGLITSAVTSSQAPFFPMAFDGSGSLYVDLVFNFGQQPFVYAPPTGYKSLNTFNLP